MSKKRFYMRPEELVTILAELARNQNEPLLAEVLESCRASIVFDRDDDQYDWSYYSLHLDVPHVLFAKIEQRKQALENFLEKKCQSACPPREGQSLRNVAIGATAHPQTDIASNDDVDRIWEKGLLRAFLSHTSKAKIEVAQLKTFLRLYGISAFVAHDNIAPTKEWQREIELALRSMDMLAAIITPGFHESKWTDQEVGYALGRGILVLPVRLGADPYGFIGKIHAVSGSLDSPKILSESIVDSLLSNEEMAPLLKRAMISALEGAQNFDEAIVISKTIKDNPGWPAELVDRMEAALLNTRVANAYNVPERLKKCIKTEREGVA